MAYTKNIAVIKGIKDGFSSDGGALSGLVKAEKYGRELKIEVSFLNFAPLTDGRFVCAVTDGKNTAVVENGYFEGASEVDTGRGFAALICYVNGAVFPVASAICGNYHYAVIALKEEVEKLENLKTPKKNAEYEDEAIAEDNYYEYEDNESDDTVRPNKTQEKDGQKSGQNAQAVGAVEEEQGSLKNELPPEYAAFKGLSGGAFYEKTKEEIENIFKQYPREEQLEKLIEGSKWVKITYGGEYFYVFGVLYSGGNAEYLCYGVPTNQSKTPPESMKELASFIPLDEGERDRGYWVMYQDANTGAAIKIKSV